MKSGAASNAKAKVSASSYRGGSQSVSSISRNLFITKDAEDELISESLPVNVQDHANASKKDALCGGDAASALSAQMLKVHANESDSPDEITQAEVTVTPTKLQRNRLRPKDQTPKPSEKGGKARANGRKAEETPADIRSSGRERKRPRRFSNGWEDTVRPTLPEGIVTPSRKGNRSARKALAFEQDGHSVAEDLGLMDLDKHAQPKVARVTGKSGPYHNDDHNYVVQAQVDDEANQVHDGAVIDEAPNECQVRDEGAPDVPKWPGVATASATVAPQVLADSQLDPVKSLVLSRLTGHTLIPLIALEAEYSKLHSLLSATIKTGEGNSILLLGSRGVGKTCLVETAIADLTVQHAEDFHVVRLNGFLQTDDKLALREIWRQLGREMQVEQDETAQVNTYADTMASLLYLLSHPDELAETLNPNSPANTTKSVVFVLDEFDLFTSHVRQTLLYNLFDIAQARKAPIAVVGCSVRIDVVDALEKRVKSRYSHRWIHLSQAKSLPAFEDIAKAALTLREHDHSYAGRSIPARVRADWNTLIEVRCILRSRQVDFRADLIGDRMSFFPLPTSRVYCDSYSIPPSLYRNSSPVFIWISPA